MKKGEEEKKKKKVATIAMLPHGTGAVPEEFY